MKKFIFYIPITILVICNSCIGNDIIDDEVEPVIRILNPIQNLEISDQYQFNVQYFNNIGVVEDVDVTWQSSDITIVTVDSQGIATGIAEGVVTIKATVFNNDTIIVEDVNEITVTPTETVVVPTERTGVIMTTSSYTLSGTFTMSEIEDTDNLLLSINSDYQASTNLPGLYLYLTNNPSSINQALSLGPVNVFSGAHSYEIENVGINDYEYLLYWCEPFSVKVGEGVYND